MGQWGGHAISRKSRNEGMEAGRHGMYGRVGTRNQQEGEGLAGKGERALEWTLSTKKAIFFLSLESYNSSVRQMLFFPVYGGGSWGLAS